MDPIQALVAEFGHALAGPRRFKADLLTEVRDGLTDAAEAYVRAGLEPLEARRRAVADFGPVAELAPGYQRELAAAQGRRTAVLICVILAPQHLVWAAQAHVGRRDPSWVAGPGYAAMSTAVEWLGAACLAAALAGLVWGRLPARATGYFAGAVALTFTTLGLGLTLWGPTRPWSPEGVPWSAMFLVAPMAVLTWWATRCVRFSRSPGEGPG